MYNVSFNSPTGSNVRIFSVVSKVKEGGDGVNLRPVLIATLAHMKALRRAMLTGTSEIDEKLKQFDAVKAENEKLAYQISHLKRSLEAEEK